MTLVNLGSVSWSIRSWERVLAKVLAMPMSGEPVPALTSGPAFPAILFPDPFRPGKGCKPLGEVVCTHRCPAILFPELFGPGRGY